MPVVSLPEILDPAFEQRYGVVAFNAVDDVTMDGLIRAAEAARSPLVIQTSVKTVRAYGRDRLISVFRATDSPGAMETGRSLTSILQPGGLVQRSTVSPG